MARGHRAASHRTICCLWLSGTITASCPTVCSWAKIRAETGASEQFWYRYFMRPDRGWWVGINANLASTGVGLIKASRILSDPRLAAQAQRQLDWILGANPHNASTVEGVGHNHPGQFINGSEFQPATPRLPGAVMNGIGGTQDDQPHLYDGQYNTAEYWTPMVAYTMWLMAELQR